MQPPENPAGEFVKCTRLPPGQIASLIDELSAAPARVRTAVAGLSDGQLDTRYRNWTIRQIVHHIADSHINSYVRFKLALTEDRPTVKPYFEDRWVALPDSYCGDVAPAVALLDALHLRWAQLLRSLSHEQFSREFHHPASIEPIALDDALNYYVWHGRHHTAQILWLRERLRM